MGDFKSGFVSLVGRTNVGKSTLLNSLVKEKIAITANKVQTTRTAIKAILNDDNYQIIITDTPGIHKPKTKLSETMVNTAFTMFAEVDVILFLIEADSTEIGRVVESLKPIEVSEKQDFQIAFSTKFLMDALKAFETKEVEMYFRGEIRPAIITSESNKELKQLLIPVRTF